jgi:hypothetical protein
MARKYLIDKDVAKLKALLGAGKSLQEAKIILFAGGNGCTTQAVDEFIAKSPKGWPGALAEPAPAASDETPGAPAPLEGVAPKGKKAKKS